MELDKIVSGIEELFDSYEIFYLKERSRKYESREKELYGLEVKEEEGIAVRGIKNGCMTFSYTYDRGDRAVDSLIRNMKRLIPFAVHDDDWNFPRRYDAYPSLDIYDMDGLRTDASVKAGMLFNMERTILEYDRRISATRNCELHEIELAAKILNSNGLAAEGRKTLYILTGLCVAKGEDEVSWYDWSWSGHWKDMDGEKLGRAIASKAVSFLSGRQLKTGAYEGILTPQASCEMLGILSASFLAENLYKNKTRLKDRVGEQCFSDVINIIDSGSAGLGRFFFDGEGVPSQETMIVEHGVFRGFLYDAYYGKKLGKPSTGNGVRAGVKEPPRCAPRGIFIGQGDADIRASFANGIVIEDLMGTHTANPITGDFSLGAIGHIYKDGVPSPFKGVIFSGNIFDLLKNVRAAGNDLKFHGTHGSPSLYIEDMKISGL